MVFSSKCLIIEGTTVTIISTSCKHRGFIFARLFFIREFIMKMKNPLGHKNIDVHLSRNVECLQGVAIKWQLTNKTNYQI